jgi:hypothetical protein
MEGWGETRVEAIGSEAMFGFVPSSLSLFPADNSSQKTLQDDGFPRSDHEDPSYAFQPPRSATPRDGIRLLRNVHLTRHHRRRNRPTLSFSPLHLHFLPSAQIPRQPPPHYRHRTIPPHPLLDLSLSRIPRPSTASFSSSLSLPCIRSNLDCPPDPTRSRSIRRQRQHLQHRLPSPHSHILRSPPLSSHTRRDKRRIGRVGGGRSEYSEV